MASKQIKRGVFLSYTALGLSNLIGILYTPFMLSKLGQSEYGLFALASSVVGYLTILDFGFGNAIIRYTAKYKAENKSEDQWKLFGTFIRLYAMLGIFVFIAGMIMMFNITSLFGKSMTPDEVISMKILIGILTVNLSINFPFSIFGSIITANEKFVFQQIINIIRILTQPCIMIVFLLMGYKSITMAAIMTILNIIILISNTLFCFKKLNIKIIFGRFDRPLIKEIIGYSFFIFLAAIVDKLYWSTGQFILGAITGTAAVAVYAIGIQMKSYYMSFASAISNVFLPKVTTMVSQNTPQKELSSLFIRVGRIQFSILSFILCGFLVFGKQFIECWAGESYSDSYPIALILMIPLTVPLIQCVGVSILQAQARLKFRSYTYLALAISSLFVTIPLAKYQPQVLGYELSSAIWCSIGTSFCMLFANGLAMNLYYAYKIKLEIKSFWINIIKMFIPVCWIPIVFMYTIDVHFNINNWGELLIAAILFTSVYIPSFYMLSLNREERSLLSKPVMKLLRR